MDLFTPTHRRELQTGDLFRKTTTSCSVVSLWCVCVYLKNNVIIQSFTLIPHRQIFSPFSTSIIAFQIEWAFQFTFLALCIFFIYSIDQCQLVCCASTWFGSGLRLILINGGLFDLTMPPQRQLQGCSSTHALPLCDASTLTHLAA